MIQLHCQKMSKIKCIEAEYLEVKLLCPCPCIVLSSQVKNKNALIDVFDRENHNSATSLWGLLFALSKIVEFGKFQIIKHV